MFVSKSFSIQQSLNLVHAILSQFALNNTLSNSMAQIIKFEGMS